MEDRVLNEAILAQLSRIEQELQQLNRRMGQLEQRTFAPVAPPMGGEPVTTPRVSRPAVALPPLEPPRPAEASPPEPKAPASPPLVHRPAHAAPPGAETQAEKPAPLEPASPWEDEEKQAGQSTLPPEPPASPEVMWTPAGKPGPLPEPPATPPPGPEPRTSYASHTSLTSHSFPPPPPSPPRKPRIDWRKFLEDIKMLPPTGEGNLEVQIGTWWVTRIGALVGIIGIVFFALYASQFTTPKVRWTELCAIAVGVSVLGQWLERKRQLDKFGTVVFGSGLALIYFTAFAAYALPPVKVIDNSTTAVGLQFGAVLILVLCALWRKSKGIAIMATFFGYVAGFFSFYAGLNDFALLAALILGAGAVAFYLVPRWVFPYQMAVPLTYLTYGVVYFYNWAAHGNPGILRSLGYLMAYLLLFGGADLWALWRKQLMPARARYWVQVCSTTAVIVLGYLSTRELYPESLSTFYFLFGGVMVAQALAYYLTVPDDAMLPVYLVKGSALITLGIIHEYQGHARWIALVAQSGVLLFSARQSRKKSARVMLALTWLVSVGVFLYDTVQLGYITQPHSIWTTDGIVALLYIFCSAYLLCLKERWLRPLAEGGRVPNVNAPLNWLDLALLFYAALLMLIAFAVAIAYSGSGRYAVGAALLAAVLVLIAWLGRHWLPLPAAAAVLCLAHWREWNYSVLDKAWLWGNGAGVIALTIAFAVFGYWRSGKLAADRWKPFTTVDGLLHSLWLLTLTVLYFRTQGLEQYFCSVAATVLLVGIIATRYPLYCLAELSFLPLLYALFGFWMKSLVGDEHLPQEGQDAYFWAAGFLAWGYACWAAGVPDFVARLRHPQTQQVLPWVHTVLATLVTVYALHYTLQPAAYVLVAALLGVGVLLLARWPGLKPALYAATIFTLLAHFEFYDQVELRGRDYHGAFFWAALLAAVLTVAFVLLVRRLRRDLTREFKLSLQWVYGGAALLLLLVLFDFQRGGLLGYITVCWGLSSIALFLVGLGDRVKAFRLIGLIGLALCLPRMFMVDIHSTLHRIAAFVVLGMVLLLVGFLYNRFRELINLPDEG